jgi:hypothetical protein
MLIEIEEFYLTDSGSQSVDALKPAASRNASPSLEPDGGQIPLPGVRRFLQDLRRIHVALAPRSQRLQIRLPHLRKNVQAKRKPSRSPTGCSSVA